MEKARSSVWGLFTSPWHTSEWLVTGSTMFKQTFKIIIFQVQVCLEVGIET
jgi:hypothetical protein